MGMWNKYILIWLDIYPVSPVFPATAYRHVISMRTLLFGLALLVVLGRLHWKQDNQDRWSLMHGTKSLLPLFCLNDKCKCWHTLPYQTHNTLFKRVNNTQHFVLMNYYSLLFCELYCIRLWGCILQRHCNNLIFYYKCAIKICLAIFSEAVSVIVSSLMYVLVQILPHKGAFSLQIPKEHPTHFNSLGRVHFLHFMRI